MAQGTRHGQSIKCGSTGGKRYALLLYRVPSPMHDHYILTLREASPSPHLFVPKLREDCIIQHNTHNATTALSTANLHDGCCTQPSVAGEHLSRVASGAATARHGRHSNQGTCRVERNTSLRTPWKKISVQFVRFACRRQGWALQTLRKRRPPAESSRRPPAVSSRRPRRHERALPRRMIFQQPHLRPRRAAWLQVAAPAVLRLAPRGVEATLRILG